MGPRLISELVMAEKEKGSVLSAAQGHWPISGARSVASVSNHPG